MNGIDKITQRIGADTQAEIDRILATPPPRRRPPPTFRTQAEAEDRTCWQRARGPRRSGRSASQRRPDGGPEDASDRQAGDGGTGFTSGRAGKAPFPCRRNSMWSCWRRCWCGRPPPDGRECLLPEDRRGAGGGWPDGQRAAGQGVAAGCPGRREPIFLNKVAAGVSASGRARPCWPCRRRPATFGRLHP